MRITYVTEDTTLWGGIGVVFQHLELLAGAGHDVFLTTLTSGPDWYPLNVPVHTIKSLEPSLIPDADIIVATSWRTIKPVVQSKKGIAVHFCQGYEGDYKEISHLKSTIDEAYSCRIPKLTVSRHLDKLLTEQFDAETYYVGQMLNRDIFYPSNRKNNTWLRFFKKRSLKLFTILVVGPFEGDFKNIRIALEGISLSKKRLHVPVNLVRVSQFPLIHEEEEIIRPDIYHCHVPHHAMGEIYRRADLFISMSKEAEGFGLPALEAMGCGVPAILSKISSYTSFDDRRDYALFLDPDPEALAEAISKLFHDSASRERLIRKGLNVAAKFTPDALLTRIINAFGDIRTRSG